MTIPDISDDKIAELTERARIDLRQQNKSSSFVHISRREIENAGDGWLLLTTSFYSGKSRNGDDFDVFWHPGRDELRYERRVALSPPSSPASIEPPKPKAPSLTQADLAMAALAGFEYLQNTLKVVGSYTYSTSTVRDFLIGKAATGSAVAATITVTPPNRLVRVYAVHYDPLTRQHEVVKTSLNPEDHFDARERERRRQVLAKYRRS